MVRIGFIGAGKVGYALGRYLAEQGSFCYLTGYYSQSFLSAEDAAAFTHSKPYRNLEELVAESELLFLTVPDTVIKTIWNQIKSFPLEGKIICHCSGALTSELFSDIDRLNAYGYSIHPFFAVSDKYQSHKTLANALFTLEGSEKKLNQMKEWLINCGLKVQVIKKEGKTAYHAAASVGSNLVIGLTEIAVELLISSGFSRENALFALKPLMTSNLDNILTKGTIAALTGPVERADTLTVQKHLDVLEGKEYEIYKLLSQKILELAKIKNKDRNYSELERRLKE